MGEHTVCNRKVAGSKPAASRIKKGVSMNRIKDMILRALEGHTSINPMPRERLLAILQDQGCDHGDRGMRGAVAELVINHACPIGTNTHGYFLIVTDGDLMEADRALKDKALAIFERRNALIKAYQDSKQRKVQMQLI